MSKIMSEVTPDEILAAAQSPIMRLLSALSVEREGEIAAPHRIQSAVKWTRSFKSDQPEYSDKFAVEMDYRHLGFFDQNGRLIDELVAVGRGFLKCHALDSPNYARLWRHIQAHLGQIRPENTKAEFTVYTERIAHLIDDGASNVEVSKAILKADQTGLDVPTQSLWQADRLRLTLEIFPEDMQLQIKQDIDAKDFDWFPPDSVANTMRCILKDQNYGLGEDEANAWLETQGSPSFKRQIKGLFGDRNKARTLRDLGLLDENWQWSEVGFQRMQAYITEAREKSLESSLERLRWELHHRHHSEEPIPFAWTLMNDFLPSAAVRRARRAASVALSGGMLGETVEVGDMFSPNQYQTLRRVGAWVLGAESVERQTALAWLGIMAGRSDINWSNWTQICSFVYDKLDQTPDSALVSDWQDGVVTFEGTGRYQQNPAQPFKGVKKVGRNEPCPCGSGKKYKKCCGR